MRKILVSILSVICLCVGVCFVGCDKPKGQIYSVTYYGVAQTFEGMEGLFVYIPEHGVCELPSYEEGKQGDITVKEGDLIRMDFAAEEVVFAERYPVGIVTPVSRITVIDFSFSLTWGTYGISSYDSKTGELVKTKDAPNPEEYITTYHLSNEERLRIYSSILALRIDTYPDVYDPTEGVLSTPSQTLVLSVKTDTLNKTVTAEGVAYADAPTERGQNFLDACNAISDLLEATDAWKSLPEYPYLYD